MQQQVLSEQRTVEAGQSNGSSPHVPAAQALQNPGGSKPRLHRDPRAITYKKRHNFLHVFSICVTVACFIFLVFFMVEGMDLNIGKCMCNNNNNNNLFLYIWYSAHSIIKHMFVSI